MKSPEWLARGVSKLLSKESKAPAGATKASASSAKSTAVLTAATTQTPALPGASPSNAPPSPPAGPVRSKPSPRSMAQRLNGSFRAAGEAMSPRLLRRTLESLRAVVDPTISEAEGGRLAAAVAAIYANSTRERRYDLWLLMSELFITDPEQVARARAQFEKAIGTADEAAAEVHFRRATVSPRRKLLQRFANFPHGLQFLVDMRAEFQPFLKSDKRLAALDVEMEYIFVTWLDIGFLELRRITWDSPASLIERLIRYEAVHDIRSWADVKNRLDSDRRCYGFFSPRMPDVPLIFVQVALLDKVPASIVPLLDESEAAADLQTASVAVFYSISNTQVGLRGVPFGDSLIKRVVEALREEFPKLKTFVTLSPIPGYRAWLQKRLGTLLDGIDDKFRKELTSLRTGNDTLEQQVLNASDEPSAIPEDSPMRALHLSFCANYLQQLNDTGQATDPVARFHLGNGARIERLNWLGDPSSKGLKQSYGLMVNYLYDLKRLDRNRKMLAQGKVATSAEIDRLRR